MTSPSTWARRLARNHLPRPALTALRNLRRGRRSASSAPTSVARHDWARAEFTARIRDGASSEAAAVATIRTLINAGKIGVAVSFADSMTGVPDTATLGHLAAGILGVHRKLPALAKVEFAEVPFDTWTVHAPAEYLEATYRCDRSEAVAVVRRLLEERPGSLQVWFEALKYAYVADELELAKQAYAILEERAGERPDEWPAARTEIAWMRPWLTWDGQRTDPPPPGRQVPFALLDYRQPGRAKTSANIGDHVQTLASLGHLVRHRNARFHGPDELVAFTDEMQQRVRSERVIEGPASEVALQLVDRDASNYKALPEGTWLLAFGWYMHPLFGLRHDFPMHPNLRPIFVSFHCSKREMLTDAAVAYLRRYGPIGCRDWTTVDLLLSLDVPAFFSGCLTTTVDTVFPPAPKPEEPSTIYVDVPEAGVPPDAATARHSYAAVKRNGFVRNMRDSVDLLDRYRRNHTTAVTPRLHCYLPMRSLGLEVDFQPTNRTDIRFNGLIDTDNATFEGIRARMLARLEPVMAAILAGRTEDEVYRVWRESCAEDVAAARERHTSDGPLPAPKLNLTDTTASVRNKTVTMGPNPTDGIDVAIPMEADDVTRLPQTLTPLLARTSRPIRLWLLSRGCGPAEQRRVAAAFPDLPVTWLPCDSLTVTATVLLPDLLPEVDRVTVLPPGAELLDDAAELAEWDLDGHPLAARTSLGTSAASGFGRLYRVARRLHPNAEAAHELFRRMHAWHVFDFDAFDCDVFVADLAKMRADQMSARLLPFVERFGLDATDALFLYVGPDRAVLPAEWAHVPSRERLAHPNLVLPPRRST